MIRVQYLIRFSFQSHNTLIHKDHTIRNIPRKTHLMRHDHHRDLQVGQRTDNLQHFPSQLRIKRTRRLIKKEDFRVECQCPCDRNSLTLSAGKLAWISIFLI